MLFILFICLFICWRKQVATSKFAVEPTIIFFSPANFAQSRAEEIDDMKTSTQCKQRFSNWNFMRQSGPLCLCKEDSEVLQKCK